MPRSRAYPWPVNHARVLGAAGALLAVGFAVSFVLITTGRGTASAVVARGSATCSASRVHYERFPYASPDVKMLPWVLAEPASIRLAGHLFYYDAHNPYEGALDRVGAGIQCAVNDRSRRQDWQRRPLRAGSGRWPIDLEGPASGLLEADAEGWRNEGTPHRPRRPQVTRRRGDIPEHWPTRLPSDVIARRSVVSAAGRG